MDRNVNVIQDLNGHSIVIINDILFKGKRSINWKDVEAYLRQYVGEFYEIAATEYIIYIGNDLPDEYAGSKYTRSLKGASAKAKANAAQGIPELIEIATGKHFKENDADKHKGTLSMVGIVTIQDLLYLSMMIKGKLNDIMCSMRLC